MELSGIKWLNSLAQWKGRGEFGIQKTAIVYERLGSPGEAYKTFHIAGTNGKGSVSCFISSILGAMGHSVGLYTSPPLLKDNERVVIDGLDISDEELNVACNEVRIASSDVELSFFEAITLAAFVAFRNRNVEFAVIEVGLGGRVDSTNVLKNPVVNVITTIDFDHESYLGNTLALIAAEKAGIIKHGTPVVIGKMEQEAIDAIIARSLENSTYLFGRDFLISDRGFSFHDLRLPLTPSLEGHYQKENLAVAQMAVIAGLGLTRERMASSILEAFTSGPMDAYWPNRLETFVWRGKSVTIDSAHNPAGIKSLISFLDNKRLNRIGFLFGAIQTKRWEQMLDTLIPYALEFHLAVPEFAEPVPSEEISAYLLKKQVKSICYRSDEELLLGLKASSAERIICCGSMYLTGRLRKVFGLTMKPRWRRGGQVK